VPRRTAVDTAGLLTFVTEPAVNYEYLVATTHGRVGMVTLNRPKALNALNDALMDELGAALRAFDGDESIGAIVITGSEKAFAAGADIGAMKDLQVGLHHAQLGGTEANPQARDRCGGRLCARRRLRTRHDVRHRHRS